MTITEFLLARIAEDEQLAHLRGTEPIYIYADGVVGYADGEWDDGTPHLPNRHTDYAPLYDPARVLAECAAKRAIIERHREFLYTDDEPGFSMVMWDCMCPRLTGKPCPTIGALAAVYADHPDYDPGWAL